LDASRRQGVAPYCASPAAGKDTMERYEPPALIATYSIEEVLARASLTLY
jgi:hypothetical protein